MTLQSRILRWPVALLSCAVAAQVLGWGTGAASPQTKVDVLRIGTSGTLAAGKAGKNDDSALETLKAFIKEETGLENDILRQESWQELVKKLAKGDLHVGVLQGYEYAWAQQEHPELKPLAVAINVYIYPVAYVVTQRTGKAKAISDVRGQSFSIPAGGQRFLRMFLERQAGTEKLETFFSKVIAPDNVEDALDDVVDGLVQATVVDRAGLEAYKRRKPGRFKNLKEVAHSQPFPPPLVAYYGKTLDEATRERLRAGLLGAKDKEKGETMLTLFRLTAFEPIPADFNKVVAETRKTYPPPDSKAK
jgi:ABC-type phosphate/phosphonate transport system substrate-binding protein